MTTLYTRNLFLASPMVSGGDVLAVQQALNRAGARLEADGLFGEATASAVRAFQAASRLEIDGIVGTSTWTALFGSGSVGTAAVSASKPPGRGPAAEAFRILCADGWTPEQACGILGNIQHESAFNPAVPGDGGLAYGLAQWHPGRQADFAAAIGRPIQGSSMAEQLRFITFELKTGRFRSAGRLLAATTTPEEAADVVCRRYEIPANRDAESAKRARTARNFHDAFAAAPQIALPELARPDAPLLDVLSPRVIDDLTKPHSAFPGGVSWRLTPQGVEVDGVLVAADTVAISRLENLWHQYVDRLVPLLGETRVPLELVLAALDVAPNRDGKARLLPGCDTLTPERTPAKLTAGPVHALLSTARAALGSQRLGLAELEDKDAGLRAGIRALRLHGAATLFDPPLVAAAHGAGGLFPDAAPANRWRLSEGALPAGFIDRFVTAFNAAVQVTAMADVPPGVTTLGQALQTISTPTERRLHQGPFIAPDPDDYVGGPLIGSGQCVALVQQAAGAPQTALWVEGQAVRGAAIEPGTAIATFQGGRYRNDVTGLSHAALYLSEGQENGVDGIWVIDQWITSAPHPPQKRHIRFSTISQPGTKPANRGEAFSVIL